MNTLNLKRVRDKRIKLGINLTEMAEKLGLKNAGNYSKYENGQYRLRADMLPILSKVLNEPIEYFFEQNSSKTEHEEKIK